MHTNLHKLHAQALAALPETSGTNLPADIQIFPPGDAVEFTLQDHPGEIFTMRVDASVAAKAQADLEKLAAAEQQGRGSAPFADKNHEDAEATFRPVRIFWAGNDPKNGGVRVQTEWTPFGASLVKAKAFKYFSGNFLFNKAAKKFLGLINENIGGLVNRPGFAAQQAFAKASDTPFSDLDIKAEIRRLNQTYGVNVPLDAEYPLMDAADQLAEKNGTGYMLELNRLALLEPELQRYHQFLETGIDPEKNQTVRQEVQVLQSEANKKFEAETLLAITKAAMQRTGASFSVAWEASQRATYAAAQAALQRSGQPPARQPAPVALRLGRDKATAEKIAAKAGAYQATGLNFERAWSLATGEVMAGGPQ